MFLRSFLCAVGFFSDLEVLVTAPRVLVPTFRSVSAFSVIRVALALASFSLPGTDITV